MTNAEYIQLQNQHLALQDKHIAALKKVIELEEKCARYRAAVEHMDCLCAMVAVPPCAKCYTLRQSTARGDAKQ